MERNTFIYGTCQLACVFRDGLFLHFNRVELTVNLPNLNFKASKNEAITENQKLLLNILRNTLQLDKRNN